MAKETGRGQIVVLGMHRSGTSAVCRILGLMDCYLGPDDAFHPPDRSNPKGYWERIDVWALSESTLASLGSTWCDIASLVLPGPDDPRRREFHRKARKILARLKEHEPWAIKDPRLPVLFSLWRPVVPGAVCVLTYRSPLEVARSLNRRDGFSLPFGIALWERYSRSALAESSGMKRVLVRYPDLVASPLETAHRLLEELRAAGVIGLHRPSESDVLGFIDPSMQREKGDDELENRLLTPEQRELRDTLRNGSALTLDAVPPLSAIAQEELAAFSAGEARVKEIRIETDQLREKVRSQAESVEFLVSEKDTYIRSLEAEKTKLNTALQSERTAYQEASASAEAVIAEKDRYAADLESERLKLDAALKEHTVRSASAYADLKAHLAEKDRHAAAREQRIRELELGLQSSLDQRRSLRRALRERERRLRSFREAEQTQQVPVPEPTDWTGFAVCTIVAKNYLSMARVCCGSFLKHHPGARAYVLFADRLEEGFDTSGEPFEVLTAEELGIPNFDSFAFQYNILEFSTALKPFFLRRLLETRDISRLCYLDPDITVFGPMVELREALETSDVVLTPHILSPLRDDGRRPNESDFLGSGVYNLGFIALRSSSTSLDLLQWWEARLREGAFSDLARGLFTDQKWINLAPGHFPGIGILRHPGYNAAYWNIQERLQLEPDGDGWRINGQPLRFFHFSGFEKKNIERISKYQDRYRLADLGRHYRSLFTGYVRALDAAGWSQTLGLRYAYGFFDNGARIPDFVRRLYFDLHKGCLLFGNPFETGHEGSFFEWMMRPHKPGSVLSRVHLQILGLRGDVAAAYPDPERTHAEGFLAWVVDHSEQDMGLNAPYQECFRAQLESVSAARRLERLEAERLEAERLEAEWLETERLETQRREAEAARAAAACDGEPKTEWKRWVEALAGPERYRFFRHRVWKVYAWLRGSSAQTRPPASPETLPSLETMLVRSASAGPSGLAARQRRPATQDSPPYAGAEGRPRPFGVNLFGYFDTESGIGEVARSLAGMLQASGTPHVLVNVEQQWLRRECRTALQFSKEHPYAVNLLAVNADQAPHVVSQLDLVRSPDQYFIGYWFWELSLVPERFASAFSLFDEIWVATDFCLDSFSSAATVPVVKVPPAFEPVRLGKRDRADFGFAETDFVFLYVFDSASVLARKNPVGTISAFRRAFGPDDPVRLVLKTTNASPRKILALQKIAGTSRIQVWNGYFDRGELLDLVAAADAYVSLHRSEGLGLTLLEAMMLGKPVVATDYSGVRDFLQGPLAFPVGYEVLPLRRNHGPYPKGSVWAEPDITAATRQMRHIFNARRAVPGWPEIVRRASCEARDRYSVAATAPVLEKRLAMIRRTLEGRRGGTSTERIGW